MRVLPRARRRGSGARRDSSIDVLTPDLSLVPFYLPGCSGGVPDAASPCPCKLVPQPSAAAAGASEWSHPRPSRSCATRARPRIAGLRRSRRFALRASLLTFGTEEVARQVAAVLEAALVGVTLGALAAWKDSNLCGWPVVAPSTARPRRQFIPQDASGPRAVDAEHATRDLGFLAALRVGGVWRRQAMAGLARHALKARLSRRRGRRVTAGSAGRRRARAGSSPAVAASALRRVRCNAVRCMMRRS